MEDYYDWFKALHVISVIAWMCGMLYLPRLFIYHCDAETGSVQSETFKVMERRLMRGIINPAMISSFLFGILMLWVVPEYLSEGWLHVKFTALFLMTGFHGFLSRWRRAFAEDRNTHSTKFFRWWNEFPTVLMIIIVIMVIVKPWG